MSAALLVHPTSVKSQWRPTVTASLFNYGLSEAAIAIYAYLCSSLKMIRWGSHDIWINTAPVARIAEKCFKGRLPNAKAASLRRKVAQVTKELSSAGLIETHDRAELDGRRGNFYELKETPGGRKHGPAIRSRPTATLTA